VLDRLALLQGEVAAMTATLRQADPEAAVPSCPGWTVADLAEHVIGVHRWALAALDSEQAPAVPETPVTGPLADAYAAAAGDLLAVVSVRPASSPAWTFDKHNRTAGFWVRRQLHEITVHRWDVAPFQIDPVVAEDGIDEVLDFMLPRQLATGRITPPGGTLRLVSPDRTWQFGDGRPVHTAEGSPGELLLALWGRGNADLGAWGRAGITP
jgi:uncharacterized protein (TIGR03083 family)